MRFVADNAKQRIENATNVLRGYQWIVPSKSVELAIAELTEVLKDMATLEKEQPHPQPFIHRMSDSTN